MVSKKAVSPDKAAELETLRVLVNVRYMCEERARLMERVAEIDSNIDTLMERLGSSYIERSRAHMLPVPTQEALKKIANSDQLDSLLDEFDSARSV